MACKDPNCNTECNCSQCCPPTPPPVPPTPPACDGTDCVELYDAACVNYTGPAITCMGIPTGTNMNTVIQTIATNICLCCDKTECISPFRGFFERFKFTYEALMTKDENVDFEETFNEFIQKGLLLKKCKYCCPDSAIYGLSFDGRLCKDYESFIENLNNPDYIDATCVNCWTKFNSCGTTFLTLFDTTLDGTLPSPGITLNIDDDPYPVCEHGGFNNISGLCELNIIFQELFDYDEITMIMNILYKRSFWIACDLPNGNIVIGSSEAVKTYVLTNMQF